MIAQGVRKGIFCVVLQAAEERVVLKGHDFTGCGKLDSVGDGGFNPRIMPAKSVGLQHWKKT
jgi:hypothetical protein